MSTGYPVLMLPSERLKAQSACDVMPFASPVAPATYSVRVLASITGVEMTPSGLPPSHPIAPDFEAGVPRFFVHTMAPVVSSNAVTSLPLVATTKMPVPPGPSSKYRGAPSTAPS